MNNRILFVCWFFAVILASSAIMLSIQEEKNKTNFSCFGEAAIWKKDDIVRHDIGFMIEGDNGTFEITEKNKSKVSTYNFFFKFIREDDVLFLVSEMDNQSANHPSSVTRLPDFFLYQGRGLVLKITPLNKSAFLFISNDSPVLFCKKTI